jgi:hypothetical protein
MDSRRALALESSRFSLWCLKSPVVSLLAEVVSTGHMLTSIALVPA